MKIKLILMTILIGSTVGVQASVGCNILMSGFKNDKKVSVYDLSTSEKEKYDKCLTEMKRLPDAFKDFEEASEKEATKRKIVYKKQQKDIKKKKEDEAKQAKIRASREEYTFSKDDLKDIFEKPVYAYRFSTRVDFADGMKDLHYKAEKLSDADKMCEIIGEQDGIKNMRAKSSRVNHKDARGEFTGLNNTGVTFPNGFFESTFEIFKTSDSDIKKLKKEGSRAIKILELDELTCIANGNKDDKFEDISSEVIIVTKTKEIKISGQEDSVLISEALQVGQNSDHDSVGDRGDDTYVNDSERGSINDEVDRLLGTGMYDQNRTRVKTKTVVQR